MERPKQLNKDLYLTDDAVRHIRTGELKDKEFAEEYCVSRELVNKVRHRKRYGWVQDKKEGE